MSHMQVAVGQNVNAVGQNVNAVGQNVNAVDYKEVPLSAHARGMYRTAGRTIQIVYQL